MTWPHREQEAVAGRVARRRADCQIGPGADPPELASRHRSACALLLLLAACATRSTDQRREAVIRQGLIAKATGHLSGSLRRLHRQRLFAACGRVRRLVILPRKSVCTCWRSESVSMISILKIMAGTAPAIMIALACSSSLQVP